MVFEWDELKRLTNLAKHGFDFSLIEPLFEASGRLLASPDLRQDYSEERFIGFGRLMSEIVCVCFTVRRDVIRVISLRKANQREKKKYENASKKRPSA